MEIPERLKILMEARKELEALRTQKEVAYDQWVKDNDLLLRRIDAALVTVAVNEGQIKADAEAGYLLDKNKHPYPGVEIKDMARLEYDEANALAWAMEKRLALKLDAKVFEKIAKASPPEFVTVLIVPQAQIAQDLGKVLQTNEIKA